MFVTLVLESVILGCYSQDGQTKEEVEIVLQEEGAYAVTSVAFSPDGKYIASGSSDKTIKLWEWEKETKKPNRTLKGHSARVNSIAFSPDGRYIVSGSNDNTAKLWEVSTGNCVKTFQTGGSVKCVAIGTESKYIAAVELMIIRLWEETETGKWSEKQLLPSDPVQSMIFSSDGNYILCGTDYGFELLDRTNTITINTRTITTKGKHPVYSTAFSPNEDYIVSGCEDGYIKLWDVKISDYIRVYKGHSNLVRAVSFSTNDNHIFSVDENNTIKEWRWDSGLIESIKTLEGHSEKVNSAAFSRDGKYIVFGCSDGTIKLRKIQTESKSWAVVIGIDNYPPEIGIDKHPGFGLLSYSVNDAQTITKLLIDKFGFSKDRVISILDKEATKQRIERLLGDELCGTVTANDRVLIFFSGHGKTCPAQDGRDIGYLVPVDGDPKYIDSTCIPMDNIRRYSDKIPAKHVLFIVDACHSGLIGDIRMGGDIQKDQIRKLSEGTSRQVLTSGRKNEPVVQGEKWGGHSAFVYYLLKGLEGKPGDGNNVITIEELASYVQKNITADKDVQQDPQLKPLSGEEGHFIFYKYGVK